MRTTSPQRHNWGNHPAVVAILVLAGIATIARFLGVASLGVEMEEAQPDGSAPVHAMPSQASEEIEEAQNDRRLVISCNDPSWSDGRWLWWCFIRNESPEVIWWRDLEQEGAQLKWYCLGEFQGTCEALIIGDELTSGDDNSLHFAFMNAGESLDFLVRCPGKPSTCKVDGRAPGLVIQAASFSSDGRASGDS